MSRTDSNALPGLEMRQSNERFHVELTPELEDWMSRTFKGDLKIDDNRLRRLRYIVLFRTDLVDQIFDIPSRLALLQVIANLGESHAERSELVSRGLGGYLSRVAVETILKSPLDRRNVPITWLLMLYFQIDYLEDSEITCDMIKSLAKILQTCGQCLRFVSARRELGIGCVVSSCCVKAVFQTITSIALRGSSVRHLFDESLNSLIQSCTSYVEDNLRTPKDTQEHIVFQACITLASFATLVENPTIIEPAIIYFRWVRVLRFDTEETLGHSISSLTDRVIDSSDLQGGELIYAYLSLCSFTASTHVRFIGAIALSVILDLFAKISLGSTIIKDVSDAEHRFALQSVFDRPLRDTPASQIYARQALDARLRNDATIIGCHVDRLRAQYHRSSGPHSFLAEAVLRLVNDATPEIRKIGRAAVERLPISVLQQAVWSPSLHRSFCEEGQRIVTTMLILSGRGEVPIPVDILVACVFPFACTAFV